MRVLVVGQGLAGTLASHEALKQGWDVHVIDAGWPSASMVAAGMFNPMSFRRIVEVWDAEEHLTIMRSTYAEIEALLHQPFVHSLPIHKCFPNGEYARGWQEKIEKLKWLVPRPNDAKTGIVQGGGWVNLPAMIRLWRQYLAESNRFTQRALQLNDHDDLATGLWDAIIDCRGTAVVGADNVPQLDIRANRGEILSVNIQGDVTPPTDAIFNFSKWTIPLGQGQWRLGASYEWNRNDLLPTAETREFLLERMKAHLPGIAQCEVIQHEVGIRPVSRDRRPAVGPLPGKDGWFVLNGLGTRGVLIGPRWARYLIENIKNTSGQYPEIQPSRLIQTQT